MVDGLNVTDKHYMYQLISNAELPASITFDSYILMHYCTPKNDVSLAKQSPKHLSKYDFVNMESSIRGNTGKHPLRENGQTDSIMFRIMLMLHTKV